MSEIKIEKNIPLTVACRKSCGTKWPVDRLKVGDSFLVPGKKSSQVSGYLGYYKLKLGIGLTTRTVDGGVRVWRTV